MGFEVVGVDCSVDIARNTIFVPPARRAVNERARSQPIHSHPSLALAHGRNPQAYLRRAAEFHPDKHPASRRVEAATAFSKVVEAYRTLSDPVRREAYEEGGGAVPAQRTVNDKR